MPNLPHNRAVAALMSELRKLPSSSAPNTKGCAGPRKPGVLRVAFRVILSARDDAVEPRWSGALAAPAMSILSTSPLIAVLDDAVSEQDCELLIRTAKRRQPQEITSVDDQASNVIDQTSTTMHNYQLPPRLASRTAEEEAALNRFVDLVSHIFDCPPTDNETQTVRRTMPSASSGLSLGLHVDTNLKPRRFGTALLYLCDVADGCGGETIFPLCSIESPKDPLAKAARALLDAGCTHTRRAPEELIGEARTCGLRRCEPQPARRAIRASPCNRSEAGSFSSSRETTTARLRASHGTAVPICMEERRSGVCNGSQRCLRRCLRRILRGM